VSSEKAKRIAELNDRFRENFYEPSFGPSSVPGQTVCSRGIVALPRETQICIWAKVATFNCFDEDSDPHGEHDFGAFAMPDVDEKIFWKIDYYADKSVRTGSEDPADPAKTFRVLTILLASEW